MSLKDWPPQVAQHFREFFVRLIPFNTFLGMEITKLRDGFARVEIPFRPELVGDPYRPALHGGVISTLTDAAGGLAAFTTITPPDTVSTIDLRVDYLRPGRLERLAAEGTVIRSGRRIATVDVRIFHPTAGETTIATGKAVFNIKRTRVSASGERSAG